MKKSTLFPTLLLFIAISFSFSFIPQEANKEETQYAFVTWGKQDYTQVLVTNIFKVKVRPPHDCYHEQAGITNQLRDKIKSDGFHNEMGNDITVWCASTKSEATKDRDERIKFYENHYSTDYRIKYYNFHYSQD